MPKNPRKTMEETPDDPQVRKRKTATCIWLYEQDLEKFQNIPELKGTMNRELREFAHDFLNHNGFSDVALMDRKRELHQKKREIDKELYTIDIKFSQNLTEKYQQGQELLKEGEVELFITQMIADMSKGNYLRFKNAEITSVDAKLGPSLTWIKGRMKDFKGVPGFDKTPMEILNEVKKITENYRDKWDEELTQGREKFLPRR